MKLIICLEKNNGLMFNKRRLSQDSAIREKIISLINDEKLWANTYTSKQFEKKDHLKIDDNFLEKVGENDFCFVENDLVPFEKITELFIFQWNRRYPADTFFEFEPKANGMKKIKSENFKGSSHEKITLEIFRK